MRKKILSIVLVTVIFALLMASVFFVIFSNGAEYKRIEASLKNFSQYLLSQDNIDEKLVENYKINNYRVRCTYIDSDGNVTFDNIDKSIDNHLNRKEVYEAIKNGEGYAVRISETTNEKLFYYALKLDNGNILRLSVPYKSVNLFNSLNSKYSMLLLIMIIIVSVILSMRIVRTILDPLKELQSVTDRIAKGDLHIRVKVKSNDEIGLLGLTFNKMADQLQSKINEVIDRQDRLESILSSMQSGVIAVNKNDEVITINPYAKKVLGIKKFVQGEHISEYVKDYDIVEFLSHDNDIEKEIKVLYPTARELKIKKAGLFTGKENIGKVIAIHDITDIKKLENMRSEFVANVTHELKTPLTSIKGFSETLKFVDDKETRDKFLDIINKEAERLSRLITDILILSKLESGSYNDFQPFEPLSIIEDVVNMVKNMYNNKNVSINIENTCYSNISCDKDKFLQLMLNLVENAVKYSNENVVVNIKSYIIEDKYIVEIKDNGIGIPEEDIPRIFERFYRVDKSRKGGSTGLGLAIVKHIVKSYDGEINVESKLNEGTKFTVQFNLS